MSDSLIGKQLGDYQIRDLLGRGGMARVYTGYDARLDRLAAVKVINSDFSPADQAEYFERFQREARAIARLNHPNIVGVYQFGQYEESYYMAMVFVEGRDLRQILREYSDHRELIPIADVVNVVRGIGSALDYAHSRGVIHRDIKPSNIMLARDGNRAILTDFGLALSTSEGTRGETFGSAHYIAPEQAISSAKAVPQSDLYSLGICVYEMLTGKVPFDDPSAMTVALKHLQDPPPPPRSINPALSAAIEHVLLRAIDKDPARRYPSGADFIRALEGAVDNQTLPDTSELPISQIQAAARQAAQNAKQVKPEPLPVSPPPPPQAPIAPLPVAKIVDKPGSKGDQKAPAELPTATGLAEIPPPPAAAISTERGLSKGDSSAIKPPPLNTSSDFTGKANAAPIPPEDNPATARRSVWLVGLLAVLVILVLVGGFAVGQNAGLFGPGSISTATGTLPGTTSVTTTKAVSSTPTSDLTSVALIASAAPTETVTASAALATTAATSAPSAMATTEAPTATPLSPSATAAVITVAATEAGISSVTLPVPSANPPLTISPDTISTTATTTSAVSTSVGTSSVTAEGNDMLLLYNMIEFYAINQSKGLLSLTGVSFNQVGSTHTFSADNWLNITSALKPGDCYQLKVPSSVVVPLAQTQRVPTTCVVMAYYGPRYNDNYYFWSAVPQTTPSGTPTPIVPTSFNVLYNGQVIATCLYSEGHCSVSLSKATN